MRQGRKWLLALLGVLVALGIYGGLRLHEVLLWRQAREISIVDLFPGSATLHDNLWVTRQTADGRVIVFLNRSGFYPDRPLRWLPDEGQFEEPISSARNGLDGQALFGPAGQLYQVESRVQGDSVLVLPGRVVAGGPGFPPWFFDLRSRLLRLFR